MTYKSIAGPEPVEGNPHLPYGQKLQVHHKVVARLVHKYTAAGRVLDVGCGLGHTLGEVAHLAPHLELHGADMDPLCLQRTGQQVPGTITIEMPRDRFDVDCLGTGYRTCVMSHILEHLPCPLESVQQLLTVLEPGGHLILVVPNPVCPLGILNAVRQKRCVNPGHLQAWDRGHWMNFLENWVGAEVVEYVSDEVRILPGRWKRHLPWLEAIHTSLARIIPWWSFSHIAVLRASDDTA